MRKEKTVIVNDRGRELTFTIREMPATKLEAWIVRAGLLLAESGLASGLLESGDATRVEMMDAGAVLQTAARLVASGSSGGGRGWGDLLAALGRVDYEKARPLLDELLSCCTLAGSVSPLTPDTADGVLEDVRSLFTLRKEALALNFAFFGAAGPSDSAAAATSRPDSSKRSISVRS